MTRPFSAIPTLSLFILIRSRLVRKFAHFQMPYRATIGPSPLTIFAKMPLSLSLHAVVNSRHRMAWGSCTRGLSGIGQYSVLDKLTDRTAESKAQSRHQSRRSTDLLLIFR
ncbi:hypothetical protein F5883DRAFT_537201 [Diaporthe sp. PMI_573]|nr:hypothetical protein F5883DRAFT_537201 [Diaporthaceae sp. PMI_573]